MVARRVENFEVTRTSAVGSSTAIVIGGGLSGLLATRVLADRFDEVILVERDSFPDEPVFRKGVPQSRHLHLLLARGAQILDALFPGFLEELEAEGAIKVRWPADVAFLAAGGWVRRDVRGLTLYSSRREMLEHVVRRRVTGIQNVRRWERHEAVHLLSAEHVSVRGVHLRSRHDGTERDVDADLVVDASGRETRAPAWLEDLGFGVTPETTINASLGYASRVFAAGRIGGDWRAIAAFPKPPDRHRAGALFPIDHERWLVTLAGNGGDYPPNDEPGFMAFARSLRTPLLYDAIRDAVPASGISAYRRTENRLRHYDALRSWPDGFIVTGDAACCFNPVYGQGMTVAGQDALVLRRWLLDEASTREFQRRLAKSLATPWVLATSEDFRYPTTIGGRPSPATRLMHKYLDRVNAAAVSDRVVAHTFTRVLHMVGRPSELFHPEVVVRTLGSPRATDTASMAPPRRPTTAAEVSLPQELGLREGHVEVDGGIKLHYVEAGDGPPVVLLHGFPEFWYSWRHQLPVLASAGYRAIAIDLPGFGRSDKPRDVEAYLPATLGRHIARAIEALGVDRARNRGPRLRRPRRLARRDAPSRRGRAPGHHQRPAPGTGTGESTFVPTASTELVRRPLPDPGRRRDVCSVGRSPVHPKGLRRWIDPDWTRGHRTIRGRVRDPRCRTFRVELLPSARPIVHPRRG